MKAKESFNKEAKLYNEVRPTYPSEAIDWIISTCNISKEDNILEIAPGTGQATMRFGEKGYTIHAVELGDKLAEILMDNCKDMNVSVDVSPFEEWTPIKNQKYKMIYCATAFHWLDPLVKYSKTSDLLENDGYLVLLWNNAIGSNNPLIQKAYKTLFKYHPNKVYSTKGRTEDGIHKQKRDLEKEITDSGYFENVDYFSLKWGMLQSKETTIKGFYTQSSYISLEKDLKMKLDRKLDRIFKKLDDELVSEFITTVFVAKKK